MRLFATGVEALFTDDELSRIEGEPAGLLSLRSSANPMWTTKYTEASVCLSPEMLAKIKRAIWGNH